jgi:hypothetical protein
MTTSVKGIEHRLRRLFPITENLPPKRVKIDGEWCIEFGPPGCRGCLRKDLFESIAGDTYDNIIKGN